MGKNRLKPNESLKIAFSGHGILRNEERMKIPRSAVIEIFKQGLYASIGSVQFMKGEFRYTLIWDDAVRTTYLVVLYKVQGIWTIKTMYPATTGKVCASGVQVRHDHVMDAHNYYIWWQTRNRMNSQSEGAQGVPTSSVTNGKYRILMLASWKQQDGTLATLNKTLLRIEQAEFKERYGSLTRLLELHTAIPGIDSIQIPAASKVEVQLQTKQGTEVLETVVLQDALW